MVSKYDFFALASQFHKGQAHLVSIHVATKLALILSHLFGGEFGLEILLQLPGQQPSIAGVCGPIRVLQKDVTESAPVLLRRAHVFESQKPPL